VGSAVPQMGGPVGLNTFAEGGGGAYRMVMLDLFFFGAKLGGEAEGAYI
jgi:hypothetical protein